MSGRVKESVSDSGVSNKAISSWERQSVSGSSVRGEVRFDRGRM